jgi:Ca2+:H+ antiporter
VTKTEGRLAASLSLWAYLIPLVSVALTVTALVVPMSLTLALICAPALMGAVVAAVHHAEVIAHRVGEPYGTLVLSISITIIEVALIVTITMAAGPEKATLARDTIFSVIMITCNGLVGLSLLIGALRHHEQAFHVVGSNASLATLIALTTLSLVLPMFTTSSPGPTYTRTQLIFAAVASLLLWGTFVFVQTVRHRDYFLPVGEDTSEAAHAPPPSTRLALASFGMLLVSLVAVVGLADLMSHEIESAVVAAGAPKEALSVVIAMLTLLPECWAAVRAALADRLQTSLNLALGSALASIGLTIPAIALSSMLLGTTMILGLGPKELALLVLTFVVASVTLVAGRTHMLQGVVHLVIFGAFIFFALVP